MTPPSAARARTGQPLATVVGCPILGLLQVHFLSPQTPYALQAAPAFAAPNFGTNGPPLCLRGQSNEHRIVSGPEPSESFILHKTNEVVDTCLLCKSTG